MSILFFGDTHIHPFRSYSIATKEGLNSRLMEQMSILMAIVEWSNSHHVDCAIHLGDVYHAQGESLPKSALRAAHVFFEKIQAKKIILAGNHDQLRTRTTLYQLKELADIIVKATTYNIGGVDIGFIPFRSNLSDFEKDLKKVDGVDILCCHQLFTKTKMAGNPYSLTTKEMFPIELIDGFKLVVAGHNHSPQNVGNLWYVGAPLQLNHNDEEQDRGFLVYDEGKLSFIPISGPRFHTAEINTEEDYQKFMESHDDSHYYRIILNGALNVQFPDTKKIEITRKRQARSASRVTIDKKPMEEVIVEAIANYPLDDDIDKETVTKAALELWKEVEE